MSNEREVKVDVSADELKAFEDAIDSPEENQAPISSEEQKVENTEEEPIENIEENKEEEVIEENQEVIPEVKPTIKDVEGETPREKALRLEVTRLRKERREKEQSELLKSSNVEVKDDEIDYKELEESGYTQEQIKDLSKMVNVIVSKSGYVKKDQSYQEMANNTLSSFIGQHKEYAPENDKEDFRWSKFNEILKNDYNIKGKSQEQIKSIFEKVDRDVKLELGEVEDNKQGKIEAQKQKISVISHGTSSTSGSKSKETPIKAISAGNKTVIIGGHPFKGFDDDEIEDFTK
jgi:hypothetical protein